MNLATILAFAASLMAALAVAQAPKPSLYLLAGTPLVDETDSYPVTLYTAGPKGHVYTVRQIFPKSQGLFDVRDDLEGRLYVMNESQNILSVIHESDPARDDTIKGDFGGMYPSSWGVVAPRGQASSVQYPVWCNDHCWKLFVVSGSPTAGPRISRGEWSLYHWFRYRGAPVTPRPDSVVSPAGNIAGGQIMVPFRIGPPGSRLVKGRLVLGPIPAANVGILGAAPLNLPSSVGVYEVTVEDAWGAVREPTREARIVADTVRFFAFAAPPSRSKKWPVPIYVLDRSTDRWRVVHSPFVRLWPRLFGSWLATTTEEPNPAGRESPGLNNERSLAPYAYRTSDYPQVRGMYGTKAYMPGKLLLQNLVNGQSITIDTGQQDSEVLDVRKDGLVLYRVNNEIFSAQIEGDKLSAPTLVVKGEDVPEVHWAFWSNAPAKPAPSAKPSAKR